MSQKTLFEIAGRPVVRGDVLYHRDIHRTGGRVTAEFVAEGDFVTVRSPGGAVPTVRVNELTWERHPEDVLREQFIEQAKKNGVWRTTDRDFHMWRLGQSSLNA